MRSNLHMAGMLVYDKLDIYICVCIVFMIFRVETLDVHISEKMERQRHLGAKSEDPFILLFLIT